MYATAGPPLISTPSSRYRTCARLGHHSRHPDPVGPEGAPVLQPQRRRQATGKAFVRRLEERTVDRDQAISNSRPPSDSWLTGAARRRTSP